MCDTIEPVADDELIYRRIPVSQNWYDSQTEIVSPRAFAPHKKLDTTGVSVSRAKHKSIAEASRGQPGKSYYVAVLQVGSLRQKGLDVVPRPHLPDGEFDLAHAELPDLTAENRRDDATLQNLRVLAGSVIRVEGPFETPSH